MSKVPYTINVEEYICSEIELIRKMTKTLDFSMLNASLERIQFHANAMESALYRYSDLKYAVKKIDDKDLSDEDFRKEVRKAVEELKDETRSS